MRKSVDRRRFEIVHLLGKGGFGSVYLALLRAPGGFEKQVALKVLSDEDPPLQVLQRFRDEARVLGMVRDRAVVSVDPPLRVDGRWAVVMEYVDGASLAKLLRSHRTLPPAVALEIVQEVCRVLDKMWKAKGPQGRPLRLMHRDLKPGNLQITRAGEVKLLDFGLVKGDFDNREAETTTQLSGTAGYVAPERFLGQDGECSDVFSMGVVLWRCLCGRAPDVADLQAVRANDAHDDDPALLLASQMLVSDPAERPTPLQVEQQAREVRRHLGGPGLSEWARRNVPETAAKRGQLDGRVLQEEVTGDERSSNSVVAMAGGAALGGAVLGASALSVVGALAVLLVLLVLLGGVGAWWAMAPSPPTRAPVKAEYVALSVPSESYGVTVARNGRTMAYAFAQDVWWAADRNQSTPSNLTLDVEGRCYEARISPDGREVMFGSDMQVYVARADGSGIRTLGAGLPGGWLEGGEQVSVLKLQGLTSTGDAAAAELFVLDAQTGDVVAEHGIIRAEPRHGSGGWTATKRKRSQEMVLIAPDGQEIATGVDAYPVGFGDGFAVAAPFLDRAAPLLAVPFDAQGGVGEPYELVRLPHAYASDAHIAPGADQFVVSTKEVVQTFHRVRMRGRRSELEPASLPSDVRAAWPIDEGDNWIYERPEDGDASTGVRWSVVRRVDGRRDEMRLDPVPEVHRSELVGRLEDRAFFLLERSSGFELVSISLERKEPVRSHGSLPSSTLMAAVSPDGTQVAVTHDDLEVHVAPLDHPGSWRGKPLVRGEVTGWSPEGELLVWDHEALEARLVHPETGRVEMLPLPTKQWAFGPDGGAVVVVDERLHYVSYWRDVYPLTGVERGTEILESTVDGNVVLRTVEARRHHHLVTLDPEP